MLIQISRATSSWNNCTSYSASGQGDEQGEARHGNKRDKNLRQYSIQEKNRENAISFMDTRSQTMSTDIDTQTVPSVISLQPSTSNTNLPNNTPLILKLPPPHPKCYITAYDTNNENLKNELPLYRRSKRLRVLVSKTFPPAYILSISVGSTRIVSIITSWEGWLSRKRTRRGTKYWQCV